MDVDAVSIATFDIDRSGKLPLWSKFARRHSILEINESMELPFPTGKEVNGLDGEGSKEYHINLYNNFKDMFLRGKLVKNYSLLRLKQMLETVNKYGITVDKDNTIITELILEKEDGKEKYPSILSVLTNIKHIVDEHNKYLNSLDKNKLESIGKNYSMYNMYNSIQDPINLIQAQSSVDAMTGPLKKIGNQSKSSTLVDTRLPGDFTNKAYSIEENQVGKDGIGICATGMKGFFGLTSYTNAALNSKNEIRIKRAKLGKDGRGVDFYIKNKNGQIETKTYSFLSNANALLDLINLIEEFIKNENDPFKKQEFLNLKDLLNYVKNLDDAALVLSAMLSLATDRK